MKILKQFKKVSLLLLLLSFLSATTFAQTYVSNTNGDDTNGDGSMGNPFKTIAVGIADAGDGGAVIIDPDTYGEATVAIGDDLTITAVDFGSTGLTVVTITNGITVNTTNSSDVVSLGESGLQFNLGATGSALTLTKGVLNVSSANVIIASGGTITRTNGSINNSLTTTNVNVSYGTPTVDINAGPELAADIGSGTLTIAVSAARAITVPNAVTTSGGIVITSGDATFTSPSTLEQATLVSNSAGEVLLNGLTVELTVGLASTVDNNGAGDLTINGTLTFSNDGLGTYNTDIDNNSTGTLTVGNAIVSPAAGVGPSYVEVDVINASTGDVILNGGTVLTITNTNGGTVDLQADLTVEGTGGTELDNANAGSVVQLNSNTLTFTGAAVTIDNTGADIISDVAGTAGAGKIVADNGDVDINAGEVPNLETTDDGEITISGAVTVTGNVVNAGTFDVDAIPTINGNLTSTGAVTLDADVDLNGNYAQNTGGTLVWGAAETFFVSGDWFRNSNVPNDVTEATGVVEFDGDPDATFTPGASLELYDIVVNKTALADMVTLAQSLVLHHDLSITVGTVELADFHIRMETAAGTLTNGSGGYQTDGIGFVIVDHAGTTDFTGAGTFSNLDIRGGAVVQLASDINFSGILNVRTGTLDFDTFDMTLEDDVRTVPKINKYTTAGLIKDVLAGGGVMAVGTSVEYDLNYYEATDIVELEYLAAGIRHLGVLGTGTITQPAASAITGTLTVATGATLDLNGADLTASGDAAAHVVKGTLTDGGGGFEFVITGDGASITGSAADADARVIEAVQVSIAAGETFTMSQIESLTDLVVDDGAVSVSLIDDPTNNNDAQFLGDLTLTDGTLTLTIADEADDDDASVEEVAGAVSIVDGQLILGNSLQFATTLGIGAGAADTGNIELGAFNLTQVGVYTHNSAGGITGTGKLVLDYGASANLVLTEDLSVANLEVDNGINTTTITVGDLTVTGSYTHTSGTLDIAARTLEISGDAVHFEAGGITSTGSAGLVHLTGGDVALGLEANFPIVDLEVETTSLTISDQDGDAIKDAYKVTISDDFTQTSGDIALVDNVEFECQDDFTRVAGVWTMGDGALIFNGIGTIVPGTSFAVDNLQIAGGLATFPDDEPWAVNKSLILATSLDPGNDGLVSALPQLTLADDVTIERQANAATLADDFIALGLINLAYTTAGPITTSGEVSTSTTAIGDVTVEVDLVLARDITVNGTLTVDGAITDIDALTNTKDINMADGSTVVMIDADGTTMFDQPLVPAGTLNVTYTNSTAAALATDDNVFDKDFTLGTLTIDGAVIADEINLHDDVTVVTLDVIDDASLDLAGNNLTVTNALLDGVGGTGFVLASAAADLIFGGATDGALTLGADWSVPVNVDVVLNKTNDANVVTLSGGDLDFATTADDLVLTNGQFDTDAASKIILAQQSSGGQPQQGYTRTDGVIIGNVEKFIDRTDLVEISVVEYPTGTVGNYTPAVFYFKTAPASSINLLVNHEIESPDGSTGIPIDLGSQSITNYPDFYWYVKSDIAIAPSYKFDVEFQAEGYTDYLLDGIQNVRLIRRDSGNVANNWVLQGDDANYDNSTIAANHPLVKVIDATGGLTSQGSRFTYSQSDKDPVFDAALTDISVAETDTVNFTYVAHDPDLGGTVTLTPVLVPDGATFTGATGVFTWITDYDDAGTQDVTIRATDGNGNTTDTTATITVTALNRIPVWTAVPVDTVKIGEGDEYTFTLTATDDDGDTLTYSNVPNAPAPDSVSVVDTTGLLTIIPDFGEVGNVYDITVRVDDSNGGVIDSTFVVEVLKTNVAPVLVRVSAEDTLLTDEGVMSQFIYSASDADGDALTYSVADVAGDTTLTAAMVDSVFTWTPSYTDAGTYEFLVTVTDDGEPNKSDTDTLVVVVTEKNAAPVFTAELPDTTIFVGDTLRFMYAASDLDLDAVTFGWDGPHDPRAMLAADGSLVWDPLTENAFISVVKVYATDGVDTVTTSAEVTVQVTTVNVSGVISYNGGDLLNNVEVTLSNGMKDTTAADGAYMFAGVSAGAYTITAAKADQVGGALASDALETQLYVVNPDSTFLATDMQKVAADVVGVGMITSNDALAILNRSVGIDDFQVADWLFESASVTVGTANVVKNVKGIAAGDARGDYSPALGLAKASSIAVNSEDVLNIKKESEFELPITMSELAEVGSYTFKLKYAADKVEFLGATTSNGGILVSNVVDDVISVAWMNIDSKEVKVKAGGALATLKFRATELFSKSDEVSLELLAGAELTDRMAKSLDAGINIPVVAVGVPDVFALRQNYPNPFNPSTTIQYDLPENGKVTLTIYNSLGQTVGTLVNQKQVAGAYDVKFNASNLASGVYLYRVTVEGTKNFVMTKKMILMK